MKHLGYPNSCMSWIWLYSSVMLDWNKNLTAAAFCILEDKNLECEIFIVTDAYGISIDNPNVKLLILWDLLLSFDFMIQRISYARQIGRLSHFILFIPA